MEKNNQIDLFEKYVAGNCTEQEKAIVEGWFLNELKKEDSRPTTAQIERSKKAAWEALIPKKKTVPIRKWVAVAAASVLAVTAIYQFKILTNRPSVLQQNTASRKAETENTLFASRIENSMIKLPDGSIVILAKGSKLTLLSSFNIKDRQVRLVGKAFFDIKHDETKPYVIHSGDVKTTVLGTSFDIEATPGAKDIKINVIRGQVRVDHNNVALALLTKDMQIVYNNRSEEAIVKHVNAEKELAWNRQDLEFNDISLEDARIRLENQFGYKILINDAELGKQTFHYSMRAKESPESFINGICEFIGAAYTIDQKTKIISIQPLNQ